MLLGGRRAAEAGARFSASLGMNAAFISDEIGVASAVKMCRSVVIKGLEALAIESMLAARPLRCGKKEVLASLQGTFPGMGWQDKLPDYLISRAAEHGRRRGGRKMREGRPDARRELASSRPWRSQTAARQDALIDAMTSHSVSYPHGQPFFVALARRRAG